MSEKKKKSTLKLKKGGLTLLILCMNTYIKLGLILRNPKEKANLCFSEWTPIPLICLPLVWFKRQAQSPLFAQIQINKKASWMPQPPHLLHSTAFNYILLWSEKKKKLELGAILIFNLNSQSIYFICLFWSDVEPKYFFFSSLCAFNFQQIKFMN